MTKRTNGPSLAVKMRVLKRDRFQCTYCGVPGTNAEMEVDHIIAVANGGSHHMSNLTTACRACNQKKGDGEHMMIIPRRIQRTDDRYERVPDPPVYVSHPLLKCGLERVEVNFRHDSVFLFLPDSECVDMDGAIKYALHLHPETRRIHTFAGRHRDTSYFRLFNDKWEARPAG